VYGTSTQVQGAQRVQIAEAEEASRRKRLLAASALVVCIGKRSWYVHTQMSTSSTVPER
jgi:hypothetical protein